MAIEKIKFYSVSQLPRENSADRFNYFLFQMIFEDSSLRPAIHALEDGKASEEQLNNILYPLLAKIKQNNINVKTKNTQQYSSDVAYFLNYVLNYLSHSPDHKAVLFEFIKNTFMTAAFTLESLQQQADVFKIITSLFNKTSDEIKTEFIAYLLENIQTNLNVYSDQQKANFLSYLYKFYEPALSKPVMDAEKQRIVKIFKQLQQQLKIKLSNKEIECFSNFIEKAPHHDDDAIVFKKKKAKPPQTKRKRKKSKSVKHSRSQEEFQLIDHAVLDTLPNDNSLAFQMFIRIAKSIDYYTVEKAKTNSDNKIIRPIEKLVANLSHEIELNSSKIENFETLFQDLQDRLNIESEIIAKIYTNTDLSLEQKIDALKQRQATINDLFSQKEKIIDDIYKEIIAQINTVSNIYCSFEDVYKHSIELINSERQRLTEELIISADQVTDKTLSLHQKLAELTNKKNEIGNKETIEKVLQLRTSQLNVKKTILINQKNKLEKNTDAVIKQLTDIENEENKETHKKQLIDKIISLYSTISSLEEEQAILHKNIDFSFNQPAIDALIKQLDFDSDKFYIDNNMHEASAEFSADYRKKINEITKLSREAKKISEIYPQEIKTFENNKKEEVSKIKLKIKLKREQINLAYSLEKLKELSTNELEAALSNFEKNENQYKKMANDCLNEIDRFFIEEEKSLHEKITDITNLIKNDIEEINKLKQEAIKFANEAKKETAKYIKNQKKTSLIEELNIKNSTIQSLSDKYSHIDDYCNKLNHYVETLNTYYSKIERLQKNAQDCEDHTSLASIHLLKKEIYQKRPIATSELTLLKKCFIKSFKKNGKLIIDDNCMAINYESRKNSIAKEKILLNSLITDANELIIDNLNFDSELSKLQLDCKLLDQRISILNTLISSNYSPNLYNHSTDMGFTTDEAFLLTVEQELIRIKKQFSALEMQVNASNMLYEAKEERRKKEAIRLRQEENDRYYREIDAKNQGSKFFEYKKNIIENHKNENNDSDNEDFIFIPAFSRLRSSEEIADFNAEKEKNLLEIRRSAAFVRRKTHQVANKIEDSNFLTKEEKKTFRSDFSFFSAPSRIVKQEYSWEKFEKDINAFDTKVEENIAYNQTFSKKLAQICKNAFKFIGTTALCFALPMIGLVIGFMMSPLAAILGMLTGIFLSTALLCHLEHTKIEEKRVSKRSRLIEKRMSNHTLGLFDRALDDAIQGQTHPHSAEENQNAKIEDNNRLVMPNTFLTL